MKNTLNLLVYLPTDRYLPGFARLCEDGVSLLYDLPCRGKADNRRALANKNPARDPTKPWGDLPSGVFEPARMIRFDPRHRTLGDFAIPLEGAAGDALTAMEEGRTQLYVHAGRGNDKLTATYGCLRLFDRDMALLVATIGNRQIKVHVFDCPAWPPTTEREEP